MTVPIIAPYSDDESQIICSAACARDFDGIPIFCHSENGFCSIRISIKQILLSTSHIDPNWRVTDAFAPYIGFLAPEALFHAFFIGFSPLCLDYSIIV